MTLEDSIRYFTEETRVLSCMSIACGDADHAVEALGGAADLLGTPVTDAHLFDLASITKLFTGLSVIRLRDEGLLSLDEPVTAYAPQFANLQQVTVGQVLGFERSLITPARVDAQPTREAGLAQLYQIVPGDNGDGRAYSDMHAMVLKYVIEGAAGETYMDCIRRRILQPLGMMDTWCRVPENKRPLCVSCDREHRIEGDRWTLRSGVAQGTPHDPKARLLNTDGNDCPGHAGLFAAKRDLVCLCQGVLRGDVVSRESLREMARNRTGRPLGDGAHTQYLGAQCYVKHPVQYHSEVPVYMGQQAIGLSGFAGHHLSIDPERGLFTLYLGSRVLDRLSVLVPEKGRTLTDYGLNVDGTGEIQWTDGTRVVSSVHYVHLKDAHFHQAVADTLGL